MTPGIAVTGGRSAPRTGRRARIGRGLTALGLAGALLLPTSSPAAAADVPTPREFHSDGNPILSDGSFYSADAAPLVVDDTLYLYTGHDEAAAQQAGFEMHDYGVFATDDLSTGDWKLYERDLVPGSVFSWATGNAAYAGQTVRGRDGKFYWFVPVESKDTSAPNRMAVGVAVSDSPVGPWTDAIGSPLLAWRDVFGDATEGNEIIDPAIFTDDDGKVYLYWGSWGVARAVELAPDLRSISGPITVLSGLTNFYEAPWVFKRNGTYYLAYDWKLGGSTCTPSNYQACIGYATATNPLGPWTYRGIILGGTSATTVHPSIIPYRDKWYLTYHTKDAAGGGHFRRSVAIDEVTFSGDTIDPVVQTWAQDPRFVLSDNVARDATPTASFTEQPPMRLGAVNDGRAMTALLPPDQWGNFRGTTGSNEKDSVTYQWPAAVRIGGAGIQFHQDGNWIRPPATWVMEYLTPDGNWQPVADASYPTAVNTWNTVSFDPVTTTALRATFAGRPEGPYYHSVSVSEWEVYATAPAGYRPVAAATKPGVAPTLPEAIRIDQTDGSTLWAPVNWKAVDPADYATTGTFTVSGRAVGYAAELVQATVTVDPDAGPEVAPDAEAPAVSIAALGSSGQDGWYASAVTARVLADDAVDYRTDIATRTGREAWTDTPAARYVDVKVTAEGSTTVAGRATDAAGNTSAEVTRTVKIDTTAPTAQATVNADRTTTISAADALSGLDAVQYRFDAETTWHDYAAGAAIAPPDGLPHQLLFRAVDKAGNVKAGTAQIPKDDNAALTGNIATYATATASYASAWAPVAGLNDGTAAPLAGTVGQLGGGWGTWPQVGEQWARLTWSFPVTTDSVGIWWDSDSTDASNAGLIPPAAWKIQYLDGDAWKDVELAGASAYTRTRDAWNVVTFAPVTTTALRMLGQSWGTASGGGSIGIKEFQVIAAEPDADRTAPVLAFAADPATPDGDNDWYTRPVAVTGSATDDTDPAPVVEASVDGAAWGTVSAPVLVDTEGTHTVKMRAVDAAGNISAVQSWTGRIDATAPVSQVVWNAQARTVAVRAADDRSTVAAVHYSLNGAGWTAYTTPVAVPTAGGTLRYRATDEAGNVEVVNTFDFPARDVVLDRTTTVATTSSGTVTVGAALVITVTVTGTDRVAPTGVVQVLDGAERIGRASLKAGRATLTVRPGTVGTRQWTIGYLGDRTHAPSTDRISVRVGKASTRLTLSAATGITHGAQARVVARLGSGGPAATGRVTIKVDGRPVGSGVLARGVATVRLPVLAAGRHTITATYPGDPAHTGSSASRALRVTAAPSATRVSVRPSPVSTAARATVSATVTVRPATVMATGKVTLTVRKSGTTVVASTARLVGGKVGINLPRLPAGSYVVLVVYPGSVDVARSSATVTLRVRG